MQIKNLLTLWRSGGMPSTVQLFSVGKDTNRQRNNSTHNIENKKGCSLILSQPYNTMMCPRLDSNQHTLTSTTTSKWLVYQFQHMGIKNNVANVMFIKFIATFFRAPVFPTNA